MKKKIGDSDGILKEPGRRGGDSTATLCQALLIVRRPLRMASSIAANLRVSAFADGVHVRCMPANWISVPVVSSSVG